MSTEEKAVVEQGVHTYTGKEGYVPPEDPAVREKLRWFQDRKLGLMIHWGLYCQMGMVASWGLSDEDQEWSRRQVNWTQDPGEFKRQYRNLNRSFYPVRFQPQEWAGMAADCGFQYLLLTTKHHDGFCLWDTQWTDYKVTGPDCPYRTERYADLVGAMFQAFRGKGLGIGAYFSKADWHTPLYRGPEDDGAFTHRGPAYDPAQEPERWQKFVEFTQGQVLELCANYGPVDILWLDAGWVCPENGQDLHIGELAAKARALQPGLLVVDRTAGGPYENYVTPEMLVPPGTLGHPLGELPDPGHRLRLQVRGPVQDPPGAGGDPGGHRGQRGQPGAERQPPARRESPRGGLGQPAGAGPLAEDLWGGHLRHKSLPALPSGAGGLYQKGLRRVRPAALRKPRGAGGAGAPAGLPRGGAEDHPGGHRGGSGLCQRGRRPESPGA